MNEGFSLKPCIYTILSIHQIILNVMILFHNKVHLCGFSEMKSPKTMSSIGLECYLKSDTMTIISHFHCKLIKCNRTKLAALACLSSSHHTLHHPLALPHLPSDRRGLLHDLCRLRSPQDVLSFGMYKLCTHWMQVSNWAEITKMVKWTIIAIQPFCCNNIS